MVKKVDKILVDTIDGVLHVGVMYEGFLDGSEFCDFYDERGLEVKNVVRWAYISEDTDCSCVRPDDNTCDSCEEKESEHILEEAKENAKENKTVQEIAESIMFSNPELEDVKMSEREIGRFYGIIEGIEWERNNTDKKYNESDLLEFAKKFSELKSGSYFEGLNKLLNEFSR